MNKLLINYYNYQLIQASLPCTDMQYPLILCSGTCIRREEADYFVSRSEHVWNDAQDICSVMGGNLLDTYSSNADEVFMKQNVTFKKNEKFWIGLLKNDSKPVRQVRQTDTDLLRIDNGCLKVKWNSTTSSLQYKNIPCSWTAISICIKVTGRILIVCLCLCLCINHQSSHYHLGSDKSLTSVVVIPNFAEYIRALLIS